MPYNPIKFSSYALSRPSPNICHWTIHRLSDFNCRVFNEKTVFKERYFCKRENGPKKSFKNQKKSNRYNKRSLRQRKKCVKNKGNVCMYMNKLICVCQSPMLILNGQL